MGRAIFLAEVLDQVLGVFRLKGDHPRERSLVVGVVGIEPLRDVFRMVLVFGKDDRLPQTIPSGHLLAMDHQVLQHPVHGVFVEEPLIDYLWFYISRLISLLIPLQGIPGFLLLLGEILVGNPLPGELQ